MRAYVIVSSEHLVQFAWHDDEFLNRLKLLAQDNPGSDQPSDDPVENGHIIEALLSPIVLSYSLLQNNFNEACTVIFCKKAGCNLVFQQHHDLLYLGFCETGDFSIYHMQKQLHVLHEMIEFLFGPCQQNIKPLNLIDKSRNWKKLTHALDSFIGLHREEQSFLVGGVERLHLNTDLQKHYSSIVESYMKLLTQKLKSERITFGILFVRSKIIAYEVGGKSKHKISTADMLKIIILINSKHKEVGDIESVIDASTVADDFDLSWSDNEDDVSLEQNSTYATSVIEEEQLERPTTSSRVIPLSSRLSAALAPDAYGSSSASSVGSPRTSKRGRRHARKAGAQTEVMRSVSWNSKAAEILMAPGKSSHGEVRETKSLERDQHTAFFEYGDELDDVSLSKNSVQETETNEPQNRYHLRRRRTHPALKQEEVGRARLLLSRQRDIQTYPVFLHTASCQHTPFLMHLVPIVEDVTFVVLAEVMAGDIARVICKFLSYLKRIKFSPESGIDAGGSLLLTVDGVMETYNALSYYCKQLKSKLKYASDQQLRRVIELWEKHIARCLLAHFKQQKLEDLDSLERMVDELTKKLQKLFERLFLVKPNGSKKQWKEQLDIGRKGMESKMKDYLEFLFAKTCRNLSVSWTHCNYPGLLHFVLVRRMKTTGASSAGTVIGMMLEDEFFSSGLYIPRHSEEAAVDKDLMLCLKNQIWKGIMAVYSTLHKREGISEFSSTEGDFTFTSYFWARPLDFESTAMLNGSQGRLKAFPWAGKASMAGVNSPFWSVRSIEGGNGPFLLFDLHLVHFSTVPRAMIKEQSNRLVRDFRSNKIDV